MNRRWERIALGCGIAFVWGCGDGDRPESFTQRFAVERAALTPEFFRATAFGLDHGADGDKVFGYVQNERYATLSDELRAVLEPAPEHPVTPEMYEGYHDYPALTAELQRLADAYPNLIRLETAGKSVQGRELWYVVMTDATKSGPHAPKFLYHANMHGDEVVGRELMIYLIRHFAEQYGQDQRITQILANVQLFVMPSMNPDGFERGTRENARGYDINRNLPDRFTSPDDTPAGRQVEVQRMMQLAKDNHFVYGINWHGGEICFNLPWGNIANGRAQDKYGDDALFHPIGREYTELNRSMYANHRANFDHGLTYGYEWYPVNGGINDWFNYFRRSVHSVVELTVTKWPNASTLPRHWDDNREAMVTYLWRGLRGVHVVVKDQAGRLVANPEISLASSRRRVRYDLGHAHRLTGDGAQEVTVSAPGFASKTVTVNASYLNADWTTVVLSAD